MGWKKYVCVFSVRETAEYPRHFLSKCACVYVCVCLSGYLHLTPEIQEGLALSHGHFFQLAII